MKVLAAENTFSRLDLEIPENPEAYFFVSASMIWSWVSGFFGLM